MILNTFPRLFTFIRSFPLYMYTYFHKAMRPKSFTYSFLLFPYIYTLYLLTSSPFIHPVTSSPLFIITLYSHFLSSIHYHFIQSLALLYSLSLYTVTCSPLFIITLFSHFLSSIHFHFIQSLPLLYSLSPYTVTCSPLFIITFYSHLLSSIH